MAKKPLPQPPLSDEDRRKMDDLGWVMDALGERANRDGISLSGVHRVTFYIRDGGDVAVLVHRQGVDNGSTSLAFTKADIAEIRRRAYEEPVDEPAPVGGE